MNILEKSICNAITNGIEYKSYNNIAKLYNNLFEEQFNKGIRIGLFLLNVSLENNPIEFNKVKEEVSKNYQHLLNSPENCFSIHLEKYRLREKPLPNYEDLIKYSKICEKKFVKQGLKAIEIIYNNSPNYDKIIQLIKQIEKEKETNENY